MPGACAQARRCSAVLCASLAVWLSTAGGMLASARPAFAATPIQGSGSSWVALAMYQWAADVGQQGIPVTYVSKASTAGRTDYINNGVDFAASEIPFQSLGNELAQLQAEHKSYQYLPDVAGGTSFMYRLHTPGGSRIDNLNLDADAAAKIFTGQLTSWQDPEIRALNPGLSIAETTVKPVTRSDGSGTSAQFSLYLADQAPGVWSNFVSHGGNCPAPCSQWPPLPASAQVQAAGSDGITQFVCCNPSGSGSIGYVEAGWAQSVSFPVANLKNASGHFTQPVSDNVATALTHALLHADLTQDLTQVYRAPEANAYAMSSYSYMITPCAGGGVPTCVGTSIASDRGWTLGSFIIYIACAGQREAAPNRYSPLPPNLVQDDFDAVRRIPGAPAPPPIDAQHCPNPTVTNPGQVGGGGGSGGAASAGSTGGGAGAAGSEAGTASPTPGADETTTASEAELASGPALNNDQRQAMFARARLAAAGAALGSATPLFLAAALLLVLVFGPLFARRLVVLGGRVRSQRTEASTGASEERGRAP